MQKISIHKIVTNLVSQRIAQGEILTRSDIVDRVMADHSQISGEDADFHVICTRNFIKDVVGKVIQKYKPSEAANDTQLVLDGFLYLQVAYTVQRKGVTVLVPLDQLADIELEARAQEYEAMAEGCKAHAREIREYIAARDSAAA